MNKTKIIKNLYKELLYLGKDYPLGYQFFKSKLHKAFIKNKDLTDELEIQKLIDQANYVKKEVETLYFLKKYRTMKRNYF